MPSPSCILDAPWYASNYTTHNHPNDPTDFEVLWYYYHRFFLEKLPSVTPPQRVIHNVSSIAGWFHIVISLNVFHDGWLWDVNSRTFGIVRIKIRGTYFDRRFLFLSYPYFYPNDDDKSPRPKKKYDDRNRVNIYFLLTQTKNIIRIIITKS